MMFRFSLNFMIKSWNKIEVATGKQGLHFPYIDIEFHQLQKYLCLKNNHLFNQTRFDGYLTTVGGLNPMMCIYLNCHVVR